VFAALVTGAAIARYLFSSFRIASIATTSAKQTEAKSQRNAAMKFFSIKAAEKSITEKNIAT
jgi:hypothetical protein